MVKDQQVRRLKMLIKTEKTQAIAASKSGMDEKTARKYLKNGTLPSQCKKEHNWRTRKDPFEQEWETIKEVIRDGFPVLKITRIAPGEIREHSLIMHPVP